MRIIDRIREGHRAHEAQRRWLLDEPTRRRAARMAALDEMYRHGELTTQQYNLERELEDVEYFGEW